MVPSHQLTVPGDQLIVPGDQLTGRGTGLSPQPLPPEVERQRAGRSLAGRHYRHQGGHPQTVSHFSIE